MPNRYAFYINFLIFNYQKLLQAIDCYSILTTQISKLAAVFLLKNRPIRKNMIIILPPFPQIFQKSKSTTKTEKLFANFIQWFLIFTKFTFLIQIVKTNDRLKFQIVEEREKINGFILDVLKTRNEIAREKNAEIIGRLNNRISEYQKIVTQMLYR